MVVAVVSGQVRRVECVLPGHDDHKRTVDFAVDKHQGLFAVDRISESRDITEVL